MSLGRLFGGIALLAILVGALGVYFRYFEPRPEDTTAARVYSEDAHGINYCDQAVLRGAGLAADDIPKAYTPGCRAERWPAPVLAECDEPLPEEAADLRGLWQAIEGQIGHIERIEQCGNRVVVAGRAFIHDFRTSGRIAEGANDVNPRDCSRVRASMTWNDDKTLEFRAWGLVKVVTRRLEDADTLLWEYPGQPASRLKRICFLPD